MHWGSKSNTDLDEYTPSVPEMWADTVTGSDKQDVSVMLVGAKGMGKSYSALTLCYETAKAIAARKGGTWQDFFPFDEKTKTLRNVATVVQRDIIELLGSTKKNHVYLLDDVAISMNSRRFMSDRNLQQGEIFTLMRIDECVVVCTLVDQGTMDKQIREQLSWYCEVAEPRHSEGFNVIKCFRNIKHTRSGEVHWVYPKFGDGNRSRMTRVIVPAPPPFIAQAYDLLRERKTREHRDARLKKFLEEEDGVKIGTREQKLADDITKYGKEIKERALSGEKPSKIARSVPLTYFRIQRICAELGIPT